MMTRFNIRFFRPFLKNGDPGRKLHCTFFSPGVRTIQARIQDFEMGGGNFCNNVIDSFADSSTGTTNFLSK